MEKYDQMQRIMLRVPFYLSQLTIPHMKKSDDGTGVIGNMASIHAHICTRNKPADNITKFGLKGLSQSISAEGVCGRSPILTPGYYKRPDLTADAIRDGWLYSGDMGYVDEDGFLYLVDRKKDMIISGGVNVYPRDIEEVVVQHPAVREVAVFGAPHEKWGETPVAAVVLHPQESVDAEELKKWVNERVGAKFQRIQDVVIMVDFPRNVAGKTLKREMRDTYGKAR
jgi:acyl-CoA synthetase (AMP-forming)/AMP-acid ligase II